MFIRGEKFEVTKVEKKAKGAGKDGKKPKEIETQVKNHISYTNNNVVVHASLFVVNASYFCSRIVQKSLINQINQSINQSISDLIN